MDYWTPEPLFRSRTVFVLGNGPSLAEADLGRIDPSLAIAVNAAVELLPAARVLFARDASWCLGNLKLIGGWPGLAVTTNRRAASCGDMKWVAMERRPDFPPPGTMVIRYGISSGHAAVSLAIAMGASRVILLGFDGRAVEGRTHWHHSYAADPVIYRDRFVPGWAGWAKAAREVGCEILNATPNSAITEFPFVACDRMAA